MARDWGMVVVLDLFGYYGASILDFFGLQYVSAGLERLILFTYPTLTLLFGVILHGTQITRKEWISIALCYSGIAIAFMHDHPPFRRCLQYLDRRRVRVWVRSLLRGLRGRSGMIQRIGAARFTALAMLVSTFATLAHFLKPWPLTQLIQPWPVYGYALTMAVFLHCGPGVCAVLRDPPYRLRSGGDGRHDWTAADHRICSPVAERGFSTAQMLGAALVIGGIAIVSMK